MRMQVIANMLPARQADHEIAAHLRAGTPISDAAARTIASWWVSPNPRHKTLLALAQGMPFDTQDLLDEMPEVLRSIDAQALIAWVALHEGL